jgi:hypothetical protein
MNTLTIDADRRAITKRFPSQHLCRLELEQTRAAFALASRTSAFRVPAVRQHDDTSITFEYFSNARTLSYLLSYEFNAALQLIPAIADAVQSLQQDLQFNERRELGVDILNAAAPKGYLHGDLTVNNMLISEQRLVIIDWNSAKWVPAPFNYGPLIWDPVWLIQGVFLIPGTRQLGFSARRQFCHELLLALHARGIAGDMHTMQAYALQVCEYFYRHAFKPMNKWYQIAKHRNKWKQCDAFWRNDINADEFAQIQSL